MAERDILQLRSIIAGGGVDKLSDEELARAAAMARGPHIPSRCLDWVDREAEPMLQELGARLQARREEVLRAWLEKEFRAACLDDARIMEAAALMKVGVDSGHSAAEVLRRTIAAFVRELIEPGALDGEVKRNG